MGKINLNKYFKNMTGLMKIKIDLETVKIEENNTKEKETKTQTTKKRKQKQNKQEDNAQTDKSNKKESKTKVDKSEIEKTEEKPKKRNKPIQALYSFSNNSTPLILILDKHEKKKKEPTLRTLSIKMEKKKDENSSVGAKSKKEKKDEETSICETEAPGEKEQQPIKYFNPQLCVSLSYPLKNRELSNHKSKTISIVNINGVNTIVGNDENIDYSKEIKIEDEKQLENPIEEKKEIKKTRKWIKKWTLFPNVFDFTKEIWLQQWVLAEDKADEIEKKQEIDINMQQDQPFDFSFFNKENIENYYESYASKLKDSFPRKYQCSYEECGKILMDGPSLKKHMLTHGDKQYFCKYEGCGKKFLDNSKLRRHMLVHTGEKPFKCDICGKMFSLDFNLKTHLRTHTGEKPYYCSYAGCDKRFTQSSNLTAHEKTHKEMEKAREKREEEIQNNNSNFQIPTFAITNSQPAQIFSTNSSAHFTTTNVGYFTNSWSTSNGNYMNQIDVSNFPGVNSHVGNGFTAERLNFNVIKTSGNSDDN